MVQIENLNEHGLQLVIMAIEEMFGKNIQFSTTEAGAYFNKCWCTPETCYYLYKLLTAYPELHVNPHLLSVLKNGTNHPELL